ncbi:SUN domain-containing ossification factor isoform X2 [Nelusetta ayraudi]|uniref:SUN domain-containing ossification factor isoform X2 n=1 Tax=Nelusetta ayraudi TaxID=303726 RepID=UPI003F729AF0
MCNTARSLHVGIKISKPPPPVCVSLTRVSDRFQAADSSTTRETDPSVPSKEDIPTFDEWKKQVMEVEMEKSQSLHTSTSGGTLQVKKVQKNFKNNYASVECGAKILSANSEAKSTSSILKENMDLYMLNPCSTKIWFVIELCEPIQVKQLDIANFELFSSTPKDFLISISDRYPTSKWLKLGTFHARDERIVQSFPLDEQLFAKYLKTFIKYIKVELLSHFGSEHFCPLSLFRVFGTSMVEEYEEIAESQYLSERLEYLDEDYDYPPGYQPSEDSPNGSKNLLGSATNAILNMVNNIAANVLGGASELGGELETGGNTTTEKGESGSPEVPEKALETPPGAVIAEPAESEQLASQQSSADPSPPAPDSPEERQIVTLVVEEEEEEEEEDQGHKQSTVTLMEEEDDEKREEEERQTRRDADRNHWDSQTYCPFSSFSSLSLSCVATLPELLHRWCSARLAKVRLRSAKRRQLGAQTQPGAAAASPTGTLPPSPVTAPPPVKDASLPLTEAAAEPDVSAAAPNAVVPEADATAQPDARDAATPELSLLLEPSRTVSFAPHSFSDIHSSPPEPPPPIKVGAQDAGPTPTLQAVTVPETQQASSATPALTVNPPQQQPVETEAASPGVVAPPAMEQPVQALPTASRPEDLIPPPTELPPPLPASATDTQTDTVMSGPDGREPQGAQLSQANGEQADAAPAEPQRVEEAAAEEDLLTAAGNGHVQRTATDFYAELQNGADYGGGAMNGNGVLMNGGAVHGSSQKESVFMRLNNRIKALEMNMSLSSRYLEELSQRYRKQMEEMQKAFNKTIIKLQNTSRIAQEQDQKQTDSIQVLQNQLENVTRLMLNLTATVGQLQREVSDRQSYLVVSLVLCLFLGLVLCLQCCRSSTPSPTTPAASLPKSNHYPSPKRCFSSYDDMSLKRRVACPLVRSKSFHLCSSEGPDDLYIVEPLRFSPEKKKKRCKTKSLDKVDILKDFESCAPATNGGPKCNGFHSCLPERPPPSLLPPPPPSPLPPLALPPPLPSPPTPPPLPLPLLPLPAFLPASLEEAPPPPAYTVKESTSSETSSCCSSYSEEGPAPPPAPLFPRSVGLCNGHGLALPVQQIGAKTRQEKRSEKRRRSRQAELQFPTVPSLQQLMKGNKDISVGTIGVTAVTGHV